jgi:hypothetical protein
MPPNPTTVKFTDADTAVIATLKEKHGYTSLISTIRDALTYTLIHKPVKEPEKKSKKSQKAT